MNRRSLLCLAVILGLGLGELSARVLFVGSWYSLVVWGIAGMLVGYRALDRGAVRYAGLLYGFTLVAMFILAGYGGAMTVKGWVGAGILALIFGALGALGGWVSAVVGNLLKNN